MRKLDVIAFESFLLGKAHKSISASILGNLFDFISKSYHLATPDEFERLIIQTKKPGELVVLYGVKKDIAGFCRIFLQKITVGTKELTVYTATAYLNHKYNAYPTTASVGLSQGIKYKLEHPEEEIIYIGLANSPAAYEFFYQLMASIYPKPAQPVPNQILKVINLLKKKENWLSTGMHPMVVNSPIIPIRSYHSNNLDEQSELNDFYLSVNPDYKQGNSLLVYIPLNLANINFGINPPNAKSYYENPPHHLYPGQEDSINPEV